MAEAAKPCLYTFPKPTYCLWLLLRPPGLPLNLSSLALAQPARQGAITTQDGPAAPEGGSGPSPAPGLAFLETHPKDQGQRNWSPKVPSRSEI